MWNFKVDLVRAVRRYLVNLFLEEALTVEFNFGSSLRFNSRILKAWGDIGFACINVFDNLRKACSLVKFVKVYYDVMLWNSYGYQS